MGSKLAAVKAELDAAERAITEMRSSATLDALETHWKEFLGRLVRVWYKTQASLKGDPKYVKCQTVTRVTQAIKEDELIRYLHMARHTEEHTVNPVSRRQPGRMTINGVGPNNSLYIRRLEIRNGQVLLDAPLGATVNIEPARVTPEDIQNKYGKFSIPKSHLGKSLEDTSLLALAALGLTFYRNVFAELEADGWGS